MKLPQAPKRWSLDFIGDKIEAFAAAHDAAGQMIDTSIVRVHQHGACIGQTSANPWGGHAAA